MTGRKARKHAKSIIRYIEEKSGYTASKDLKRIIMKNFVVTIQAHGEVHQQHIESLVRVFGYAKAEHEKRERTEPCQEYPVLSAS